LLGAFYLLWARVSLRSPIGTHDTSNAIRVYVWGFEGGRTIPETR